MTATWWLVALMASCTGVILLGVWLTEWAAR